MNLDADKLIKPKATITFRRLSSVARDLDGCANGHYVLNLSDWGPNGHRSPPKRHPKYFWKGMQGPSLTVYHEGLLCAGLRPGKIEGV